MFIVRYCNARGQLIDQIVLEYRAYEIYREIKAKYKKADLILRTNEGVEYTLM